MRALGFWRSVALAIGLSVLGTALWHLLSLMMGSILAVQMSIAAMALVYALVLLRCQRGRSGRLAAFSAWLLLSLGLMAAPVSLLGFALAQLAMLWLMRSVYSYRTLLPALGDAAISGIAVLIAIWTLLHSHSLLLTLWSFWLCQALVALLPPRFPTGRDDHDRHSPSSLRFDQAHDRAREALAVLASGTQSTS
ncbi:MAG: hypothetical protein Tsb002_19110 [Wenzhouxiangellaceae bacterium]